MVLLPQGTGCVAFGSAEEATLALELNGSSLGALAGGWIRAADGARAGTSFGKALVLEKL